MTDERIKLSPMEQAMTWERMSGERLSDAERKRIMQGGEFHPPSGTTPKPTSSRRSDWPRIRADLEQRLATIVHQFIAQGSLEPDALRAFAKELARVSGDLDHLDSVMSKASEIDKARGVPS